jgi:hypothetical protein
MRCFFSVVIAIWVGGCGLADVGTTAATAAKLQAQQAQQAQQAAAEAKAKVEAAMTAEQQRLRQAEGNTSN